jgi:methylmalonyl-CoA mutase N-terminal domain/subunit
MFEKEKIMSIKMALEKGCFLGDSESYLNTESGILVKSLYTPLDISEIDYLKDIGFPGSPPFTRGAYPEMYQKQLWTHRQVCGYGTAEETNKRLQLLNKIGQTGLNIVPDTPTIYGLDSDDPLAEGEVGREGVAIDSLEDMRDMLDGIPLDKVSTSIIYNYPILFCMYLAVSEERGIPFANLSGTLQNDAFTVTAGAKAWIVPPRASLKLSTDVLEFCTKYMPRWNPVSLVGYHYREAGCTAVQEIAFTLSSGIAYVEAGLSRGLKVDEFAPRLSFFFDAHNDFFEEICKFRAARRLWARIMKERFKAENPNSMRLRFHTQTAGCSLTAQQPINNIIRTTIQALAAVLGGTQSLHTNSYDEAFALPSEEAVKIALRTQQIIAYESGVTRTIDPLGGSYFIETLTNQIEERAEELIKRIDEIGGMLSAVEKNFIQREITESAIKKQKRIESGQERIVGVNIFTDPNEKLNMKIMKIPIELELKQLARLQKVRKERDEAKTQKALNKLEEVARKGENTIEATIEAVKAMATTGEIGALYQRVYGKYYDPGL